MNTTIDDKAKELVDKFMPHSDKGAKPFRSSSFLNQSVMMIDKKTQRLNAKQCALICIQEMLDRFSVYKNMHDQEYFDSEVADLQKVKEKIQSL